MEPVPYRLFEVPLARRSWSRFLPFLLLGAACSSPERSNGDPAASGGTAGMSTGGSGGATGGTGGAASGAGGTGGGAAGSGGSVLAAGGASAAGGSSGTGGGASGAGTAGGTGGAAGASGGASGAGAISGAAGVSAGGTAGTSGGAGTSSAGSSGSAGSAGAVTGDGCTPGTLTMTGELMGRYDTLKPTIDGREYFMQVNEWNSTAPQVMAYGGDFFFKMTTQMASVPTTGGPTGFPSIFIGANSRHVTMGSNLPKQVSALTTVPTTWIWNDNGTLADPAANIYNAAYDVWFSTNAAGEPNAFGPSGGYLMVWLYDPEQAEPIGGDPMYEGVTVAGVPGTWDVWIGPNGDRPCISYVRTEATLAMSFDLNHFIKDAVTNRPDTIQNDWHLTNIFTGFEIWSGGVGLESTAFCAVVN
jgi:hypothetical protein